MTINKCVILIIQARMGSHRLPGKSLMDLAGAPLVGRILERVKRCKRLNDIILAIPNTKQDEPLRNLASKYNVKVFLGSENDLVGRYYGAAIENGADVVVRLPADNATPEPEEIDRIVKDPSQSIRGHEKSGLDFLDRIGSSSKPVPPDVIEYSLDDGKTWSHILDYES